MKRAKNVLIVLGLVIIYLVPVIIIYNQSNNNIKKYVEDTEFDFGSFSYGDIVSVQRMDMEEYYKVKAVTTIIDTTDITVDINQSILVTEGEEIKKGQTISKGTYSKKVAPCNGIIARIEMENSAYRVAIYNFENIVYKFSIPEKYDYIFGYKKLYDKDGNAFKLISASKVLEEGNVIAYYAPEIIEGLYYGEEDDEFSIYTGNVCSDSLVVKSSCIYTKEDNKHYVRQVDESGKFIEELEVGTGLESGEYTCITGVDEGIYCDSGYGKLMGNSENE